MPGYIEDRWWSKRPAKQTDSATGRVAGEKFKLERHGQGKRYRVCGIPGVKPESFQKIADAKVWLSNAQTDSRRGEYLDPRLGQIILREYVETVWWPGRSDPVGTAGPMKSKIWNHILPYLGHLPLAAIKAHHLKAWLAALRQTGDLAESTIEVIWVHLTSILKSAVGSRIPKNPCSGMADERPSGGGATKARAWTPAEVHAIRAGLGARYAIAADLGTRAGYRQGEALAFSPDDIDEDLMVLHLRRQLLWDPGKAYYKLPKGKKERDVPLSPGLLKALRDYEEKFPPVEVELPWHGPGNDGRPTAKARLLITTHFHNRVNASTFNKKNMKPALAAAGLIAACDEDAEGTGWEASREKMFHRFRHTYASVQLHAGEDVVSLSHWMGHASPETTLRIYAHFMPDNGLRGRTAVDAWLDPGS
jgi:integrase